MKIFFYFGLASGRTIHFNPEKWSAASNIKASESSDSLLTQVFIEKSRKIGRKHLKNIQKSRKTAKTRTIAFNPASCSYMDMRNQLLGQSDQTDHCNGWKFDKFSHTYVTFHQTKY